MKINRFFAFILLYMLFSQACQQDGQLNSPSGQIINPNDTDQKINQNQLDSMLIDDQTMGNRMAGTMAGSQGGSSAGSQGGSSAGSQGGSSAGSQGGSSAGSQGGSSAGSQGGSSAGSQGGSSAGSQGGSSAGMIAGQVSGMMGGMIANPSGDDDNDGILNGVDNCLLQANHSQQDSDMDAVGDACDNCPNLSNIDQNNIDSDQFGDLCDPDFADLDVDSILNEEDNCPYQSNTNQRDIDMDGRGDLCDNCLNVANFDQLDQNQNGIGDACEMTQDRDMDGILDINDNCPTINNQSQNDSDMDGRGNPCDNCQNIANFNQLDTDHDGLGDACDQSNDQVVIELTWMDQNTDFDLHLINPNGKFFGSNDCQTGGNRPAWCASGPSQNAQGDNAQDMRETIILTTPQDGLYLVGVDLYSARNSSNAQVKIYCRDQSQTFYSGSMRSNDRLQRAFWEVAKINTATCEILSIQNQNTINCSDSRVCQCPTCDQGICANCNGPCDFLTGMCDMPQSCQDLMCDMTQTCDPQTLSCVDLHCLSCNGANDSVCGMNAYCVRQAAFQFPNIASYACSLPCDNNRNCPDGQSCRNANNLGTNLDVWVCVDDRLCR